MGGRVEQREWITGDRQQYKFRHLNSRFNQRFIVEQSEKKKKTISSNAAIKLVKSVQLKQKITHLFIKSFISKGISVRHLVEITYLTPEMFKV